MPAHPWTPFYWADYNADAALRACSLAAQGLWMRMLCIMAQATPIGYLRVGNRDLSTADLAKSLGATREEIEPLIKELQDNAVFSITTKGSLYNRKMVRNWRRAENVAAKNGGKSAQAFDEPTRKRARQTKPPAPRKNKATKSTDNGQKSMKLEQNMPEKSNSLPSEFRPPQPFENTGAIRARSMLYTEEEEDRVLLDRAEYGDTPSATSKAEGVSPVPPPQRANGRHPPPTHTPTLTGWRAIVRRALGQDRYRDLIEPCRVTRTQNIVTITAPRPYLAHLLERDHAQTIHHAITAEFGANTRVRFAANPASGTQSP